MTTFVFMPFLIISAVPIGPKNDRQRRRCAECFDGWEIAREDQWIYLAGVARELAEKHDMSGLLLRDSE